MTSRCRLAHCCRRRRAAIRWLVVALFSAVRFRHRMPWNRKISHSRMHSSNHPRCLCQPPPLSSPSSSYPVAQCAVAIAVIVVIVVPSFCSRCCRHTIIVVVVVFVVSCRAAAHRAVAAAIVIVFIVVARRAIAINVNFVARRHRHCRHQHRLRCSSFVT